MSYESKPVKDLENNDLMPSGKYQGEKMIDVPAKYLLYVFENNMCTVRVKDYIRKNLDVIKDQIKKEEK